MSKCRFIRSRIIINTIKKLYVKYLVAKSKMAAIFQQKIKNNPIRYELVELY